MGIQAKLSFFGSIIAGFLVALLLCFFCMPARAAGLPRKGTAMPAFELPSPANEADVKYLGLNGPKFKLGDVECKLLVVEIIGVYCPYCYEQAPIFNKLYARLARKNLADKVKMLAVAAGGTANEVEYLRKNGSYEFPVTQDESFAVHKLLGEPKTPFTILMTREGKVLHTHPNIMEDIDGFLQIIEDQLK